MANIVDINDVEELVLLNDYNDDLGYFSGDDEAENLGPI